MSQLGQAVSVDYSIILSQFGQVVSVDYYILVIVGQLNQEGGKVRTNYVGHRC